jgi:hypothetical protein
MLLAQDCVQRLAFVLAVLNFEYRYCDGIRKQWASLFKQNHSWESYGRSDTQDVLPI